VIVCVCRFVSDRAIRAARAAGARTIEAVAAATGAGSGCGCCRGEITRIVAEPCRAEPCAGCPGRAAAPAAGAVPTRIAADRVKEP
jgi:bacterioferritin-associated ferredoxin